MLSLQMLGDRNIPVARAAYKHAPIYLFSAEWTEHVDRFSSYREGTFNVKIVVAVRPSLSRTSTRIKCSPFGTSASARSMPVGRVNALTREVKSTAGDFT